MTSIHMEQASWHHKGGNHGGGGFDHIGGYQLYTHQHALKVIWSTIMYNMMAHEISDKDNYSRKGFPST